MNEFLVFLLFMSSCEKKKDTTHIYNWEFIKVRGECFLIDEKTQRSIHFKCFKGKPLPKPKKEYK